ncbi:MAG: DUF58 domain-containing protein [Acidobacteriota bacterium]
MSGHYGADFAAIRDLDLRARVAVTGARHGPHTSPLHGFGAEFREYRHYRPGDDLKHVDWKAYARTRSLYTRRFTETTNLEALIVVDASASMDFHGKFPLARTVAAALAMLVVDQGDAAGLVALGSQPVQLPASRGVVHMARLLAGLTRLIPDGTEPFSAAVAQVGPRLPRHGLVVAVSDFYDDALAVPALRRLARAGHDVVAVQVLADEEVRLVIDADAELVEAETARSQPVAADLVRSDYRARLEQWRADLRRALVRDGVELVSLSTADRLDLALRRFLLARRGGA